MSPIPPSASAATPSAAAPVEPPSAARRRSRSVRLLRGFGIACAALLGAGIAAWLLLQWAVLPRIERWRPALEARASAALGVPVRIGALRAVEVDGAGLHWTRAIELRDVRIDPPPSADDPLAAGTAPPPAVRLPRVLAVVSPASLLPGWDGRWRLRFDTLQLDGPQLAAHRAADGRIVVAGFALDGAADGAPDDGEALDWFFSQHAVVVHGGELTWTDAARGQPPLRFGAVEFSLRNGVRRHVLRLDATPPADWGQRVSLQAQFSQPLLGAALGGAARGGPSPAASVSAPGRLLSRPGDWRRWQGRIDVDLPGFDMAAVQRAVALPLGWQAGQGRARVQVDVRQARAVGATADLDLRGVALQPEPGDAPLAFDHLHGRVTARDGAEGGALQLQRVGFVTADGIAWPASDAALHWRRTATGSVDGGTLRADRFDLDLLQRVLGRLPARWLPAERAALLAQLAPRGTVDGLDAQWDGAPEAPRRYRVRAQLRGLGLQAAPAPEPAPRDSPGRPGIERADVDLDATEAGGSARLAVQGGAIDVPGVLEPSRVPLDRLEAQLAWRIEPGADGRPPQLGVEVRDLVLANADLQAELGAHWSTGDAPSGPPAPASAASTPAPASTRYPGRLDMTGRITRADAAQVARYLPLGIAADARHWVAGAIQAGRASASFRVNGDLEHFPFSATAEARGRGAAGPVPPDDQFRVQVQLEGVRLAYVPEPPAEGAAPRWPAFTDVGGELVFDRDALELKSLRARLGGVASGQFALTNVHGGIRRLAHDATLQIDGAGRGPLADLLAFATRTPIDGWTGGAFAQMAPAGAAQPPVELDLALTLPLAAIDTTAVKGRLRLAGNDLRLRADLPPLGAAKAQVAFTERGFALTDGSARALGGDIRFEAAQPADGPLQVDVQGSASADGLRAAPELGALAQAARRFSGQAGYRLHYALARGQSEFGFSSDLQGLALDLPAPLGKRAEQALPLRIDTAAAAPPPPGAPPRDELRVLLGAEAQPLLQAQWLRELAPSGPRVLRGGIGVQDQAPQPAEGVAALLHLPRLDADAWQQVADALAPPEATAASGSGAAGAAAGVAGTDLYLPSSVVLRADQLVTNGRRLHHVVAGLSRSPGDAGLWRGNVAADELDGYAEYRPADARRSGPDASGRIYARLARLAVPDDDGAPGGPGDAVTSLLEEAPPSGVPALDIVVDDFELRGKRLGRLEIQARNRTAGKPADAGAGDTRGWALSRFRLGMPEGQFDATGQWLAGTRASGGRPRAVMDFKLDVADGGGLLGRLGQPGVVKGARGRMNGQIQWLGSPLAVDYPSLSGKVSASFERGQFLQAEPGIAKLLGVLSLQSLPRRLLLDFRDVFQQGFAFDSAGGDVTLAQGVASTRNLRMRGVQAVVLMEGRADVARETQDLSVWVVPEFNTGAASLAVAAINPAIGLGSFVAQWLLRRPIVEAGTREFRVSGSWTEPQVDRVDKRARDAPPPADGGDAAPAPDLPLPDPTATPPGATAPGPSFPTEQEPTP